MVNVAAKVNLVLQGLTGAVSYPLKGIDEHIAKSINSRRENPVEIALSAEGQRESLSTSAEGKESIIRTWMTQRKNDQTSSKQSKKRQQ